ncbi:MAG: hypothetical protein H5T99_08350 [Moorella sp. (in: Bacteria)]|nr:hypothetical protein [Moorella sp. (in: firmicutes)]
MGGGPEILPAQARLGQLDGIPVFRVDGFVSVPSGAWKQAVDVALALGLGIVAVP